jgi:hypothetical protein
MSTQEIIRELAKLNRDELTQVDLRLHELLQEKIRPGGKSWGEALLEVAGTITIFTDYRVDEGFWRRGLFHRYTQHLLIDGTPALSRSIDNSRVCSSQQNGF